VPTKPVPNAAFLLSQLGSEAAARFAKALAGLELTPALAGVLRALAAQPGLSQQELARALGAAPSRVVGYLDELQARGALLRAAGDDRRVNRITLTEAGLTLLEEVTRIARNHNESLLAPLTSGQRRELRDLLAILAGGLGLLPSGHPGYARADGNRGAAGAPSQTA
jgi:DNA-binding MarR family transcriptional regulator